MRKAAIRTRKCPHHDVHARRLRRPTFWDALKYYKRAMEDARVSHSVAKDLIMQSAPLHPCIVCFRPTNTSCGQCKSAWYCSPEHFRSVRMLLAFAETTVTPHRIGHAIVNNALLEVTTTTPSVAQLSVLQRGTSLKYLRFYFLIKKVLLFLGGPYFFF